MIIRQGTVFQKPDLIHALVSAECKKFLSILLKETLI